MVIRLVNKPTIVDMMSFDDFVKRQFIQMKYKPKKTDISFTSMTITTSVSSHTIDVKDLQHICTLNQMMITKREINSQYVIGHCTINHLTSFDKERNRRPE